MVIYINEIVSESFFREHLEDVSLVGVFLFCFCIDIFVKLDIVA